jgi:hypothetical protein
VVSGISIVVVVRDDDDSMNDVLAESLRGTTTR